MWGSGVMIQDIEEALLDTWRRPINSPIPAWMGAVTRMDILIATRGCSKNCMLFFEIGVGGFL